MRERQIAIALSNLAMYVTLLVMSILLSNRIERSSFQTGMILAAMSVAMAFFSPLGGRWADRMGRRLPIVIGLTLFSIALFPLVWRNAGITISTLMICLVGAGGGLGLSASALQTSALESVADQAGVATGIASTSRYVGSIIGSSILTGVLGSTPDGNFKTIVLITARAAWVAASISLGTHASPPQSEWVIMEGKAA